MNSSAAKQPVSVFFLDPTKSLDGEMTKKLLEALSQGTTVILKNAKESGTDGPAIAPPSAQMMRSERVKEVGPEAPISMLFRQIAEAVGSSAPARQIRRCVVEGLVHLSDAEAGCLAFPENGKLLSRERFAEGEWTEIQQEWKIGEGAVGYALLTSKPYLAADAQNDRIASTEEVCLLGIQSVLAVPVMLNEEPVAVVQIEKQSGSIPESAVERIQAACQLVASALFLAENLQMARNDAAALLDALNVSRDPILTIDSSHRILFVNAAAADLISKTSEEIVGRQCYQVLHGTEQPPDGCLMEKVMRHGKEHQEQLCIEAFGREHDVIARLVGESGTVCVHVFRERSELLRAEHQAERIQRLAIVGELLSEVTHELNNALSAVVGYCQLMQDDPTLGPKSRERIEIITAEAERAGSIASNLLHLARHRRGERSIVDLNELLRQTAALRQPRLKLTGITLRLGLAAELPPFTANPLELIQTFLNLMMNAEQAMAASGKGSEVFIASSYKPHRKNIEIVFSDNGPGIPKDALPNIFEPFFSTKENGSGLGLWIVKRTVEAHGGIIAVESVEGEGTTFTIEFPMSEEAPPETSYAASILLVEDESPIRTLVYEALAPQGFELSLAANAEEALRLIASRDFDLIISDLRMPGASGMELYEKVCQLKPHLREAFLFLTGDVNDQRVRVFLERFPDRHITKPFHIPDFIERVKAALDLTKL